MENVLEMEQAALEHAAIKKESHGTVSFTDSVLSKVSEIAAGRVESVKDVKSVQIKEDGSVSADITINAQYGPSVFDTARQVQDAVKGAIQNMTGLEVEQVNVHVQGINVS